MFCAHRGTNTSLLEMHYLYAGTLNVFDGLKSFCSLWAFLICKFFMQCTVGMLWSAYIQMVTDSKVINEKSPLSVKFKTSDYVGYTSLLPRRLCV